MSSFNDEEVQEQPGVALEVQGAASSSTVYLI
jgi:hypothetical protein